VSVSSSASVSVVICAYTEERWEALSEAVASVREQTVPPREIIVVVDHNPSLLARASEHFADLVVVENRDRRGLSGARNSGIAAAQGAIIAFLDDDAEAAVDWLERLLEGFEDSRVSGVGGAIKPTWLSSPPVWFPEEFNWVVGCTYRGLPEAPAPVRNLIGANMAFRRELFDNALFQTSVGQVGASMLRCDDTEFCIRVGQRRPGNIFLYRPDALVYHRVPSSRSSWSYYRVRCYTEGLAKAQIAQLRGGKEGLASERAYTFRTLPRGVARGIADTVLRQDISGLGRAVAIVAGLAFTTAGYLKGSIANSLDSKRKLRNSMSMEKESL